MAETDGRKAPPGPSDDPAGALAAVMARLDDLEVALVERRARAEERLADTVEASLAGLNTRLGRLEEAFVKAVEDSGSGADELLGQVRGAVREALEERAAGGGGPQVSPPTGGPGAADGALAAVTVRLDDLADQVRLLAALVEGHVRDAEASLGRRATEVTRRLASDLGLRPRRGG